ncbi:WASH complex subunit FAM21 isoform X2 [Poecilia reticulata]|uniref:WASH complex subunit FAM21 isoform X2 n=1 Tax=Poecilia reticulata TaxID=8081 RepID=UPI0004A2DA4A|nr:PREDICTED: WASH complex subunit FAM21C isoform X2 [Poecilia reticulata]
MSTLPNGIANGPSRSEAFSKDAQVWERPWSLEEIRQQSANWSLAADSGLFLFLQDFSQRMLSKTHEIEKQLDSLIRDTKATDSHLHSVFNDFLMLSNTQFIENRVYDEEVEETMPKADASEKQPEQEKTREQKEAELIPKMQEAVSYGLKVLESAFEHLDIKAGNSDSEDEEIPDRVEAILEPKDLYVDRPLPYLIGSQAFMEQDDVGLGDLSSDELSVDSDRDSVIDSENDKEEFNSDDDVSQEEPEAHSNQKKSSMVSFEEEEDEDSDLFEKSDEDDAPKNTGEFKFEDELAARIKGEQMTRPEGDRASLASKKKSKGRKEPKPAKPQAEEDSDDMFKPPKMDDHYDDDDDDDDDFSPFGGKSGLFSGGKGLFDDDDEGDLFSEAPKPALEEKRVMNEKTRSTSQTEESRRADKKIPAGAVSIFPGSKRDLNDNSLFGSGQSSDSEERKENKTPAVGTKTTPAQTLTGAGGGGGGGGGLIGGLFDDDEDDDFFSGKTLKKSDSAVQEKAKLKNSIDLFDDEDDDGDIFSGKFKAATPTQNKKEPEEEKDKPPEKKMPAGAISMFGPATKSLLSEGLKKRQMSTSEEKNEEVVPADDVGKAPVKPTETPHSTSLFSDDEEPQLFPGATKGQSKPDPSSLGKTGKTPLSLFDDEEEEDLFASAAKSQVKPSQAKAAVPPPTKAASSSLFSDDEDQWISPKSSSSKAESKTGGMKTSTSAPSNLPSTKTPQKSSLFNDEDDDLFADTKTSSQKKPQRVALVFEDEGDDEGKASLFGNNPAVHTNSEAPTKMPVASSQSSSKPEQVLVSEAPAKDKPPVQPKPAAKKPEVLPSPESTEIRKKPPGAVSLFGGIDVLSSKQTKGPLDDEDQDDLFLVKGTPPPLFRTEEKKEDKGKTKTVSLFDEDDEDEPEWNVPTFSASKPTAGKTPEPTEEQQQNKSTGVFQDEELLFSQTQQKDNDPDVDLFAATTKAESSKVSPMKPAAHNLFSDDDEDDIFSSVKATPPPPMVAKKPNKPLDKAPLASPDPVSEIQKPAPSPVKPKDSSSRIGKLQASLMINPAALLPGALSSMSGTLSSSSGVSSSSLSPSPVSTPIGGHEESEGGVSFDTPVQVTTLQSAHKGRAKGSALRRPQSRAARQQAAKKSMGGTDQRGGEDIFAPNPSVSSLALPPSDKSNLAPINPTSPSSSEASTSPKPLPSSSQSSSRPNELSLPVSTKAGRKDSSKDSSSTKKQLPLEEDDLFGSDGLFGPKTVFNKPSPRETPKSIEPQASSGTGLKKDIDPSQLSSIFDTHTDDLFQNVKPRPVTQKAKASPFMEDDDDDLFGLNSSATATSKTNKEFKNGSSFSTQDIFQDEATIVPKVDKKLKEKSIDAALFDDNVDIFADLTDTFKPKPKSKLKGETKSIFDDDMDDIFTSTAKPVPKAPDKSKKTPPAKETSSVPDSSNIFDDPLNVLGGN